MGNVGLLLVGAVLFVNGLGSLGILSGRSAAPLNLFVGAAQVILPTLILAQSGGDPAVINATWPSYLFGFTYIWFGLLNLTSIEPEGFGWFSLFVAGIATYQAITSWATDPIFAVIWLTWASMWALFFVLMGLGITRAGSLDLGRFAGWYLVLLGIPTCTVPAIFLLQGLWNTSAAAGLLALTGLVVAAIASAVLTRAGAPVSVSQKADAPIAAQSVSS